MNISFWSCVKGHRSKSITMQVQFREESQASKETCLLRLSQRSVWQFRLAQQWALVSAPADPAGASSQQRAPDC